MSWLLPGSTQLWLGSAEVLGSRWLLAPPQRALFGVLESLQAIVTRESRFIALGCAGTQG